MKEFKAISAKMSKISRNKQLLNYIGQEELEKEWTDYGFRVERILAFVECITPNLSEEGKNILSHFKIFKMTV